MKLKMLLGLLLLLPGAAVAQKPRDITSPRLTNREQVLRERTAAAQRLLAPGDSIVVFVFTLIDVNGKPGQFEVKDDVDERIKDAAVGVVRTMRFTPALSDGRPKPALMKIPVKLVRSRGPSR